MQPLRQLACAWALIVLTTVSALAQTTVTGTIISADDQKPLPGVSVIVNGSTTGTTSLGDGTYKLNVPDGSATLTFSFIGFDSQEIAVGNRSRINVTMRTNSRELSEVVVTALGIKKDIRNTAVAIQTVDGAALVKAREPNPINSLTGKVAGLTVGPSSELLGAPSIALRGNTDILYVVDGIPINSDTWNISSDDIDTYTVLKGASASALYGFRGKNGAILITTKRGSKDKRGFSVEVNTSQMADKGFIAIPKVQDQYGPGEYGVYAFGDGKGGGINDGDYDIWGPALNGQLIPQYDSPVNTGQSYTTKFWAGSFTSDRQPTPFTARGANNLQRFLQTGILSTNNIAVSSATDKYDLRFSVSQNYQRGLVPTTRLNITNFNTTLGFNFTPKLRFESNINFNRQYTPNIPDVQYGPNSLIYNVLIWGGADWNVDDMKQIWQPGKVGTQQIYAEYQRYNNPWFLAEYWQRGHYMTNVYGYSSLRYRIMDGLDLTAKVQATTWNLLRNEKFPYSATVYGREQAKGDYREDRRNLLDNINQLLLQYSKNVSPSLTVNALAGAEMRVFNYNSSYTTTNYLIVPGVYNFGNSLNPVQSSNYMADMRVLSAYYSADFTYKNYATLSTTGRMDKLSTLPSGKNAYFYPSVALNTVVSDYARLPEAISFLKLRASYANVKDALTQASIGATPGATYPVGYGLQYSSTYGGPTYQNSAVYTLPTSINNQPSAYYTNTLNNPNLRPSSTSQTEVGLDIRFLKNRLAFDAAYYISNDGPAIFNLPQSEASGYPGRLVNGIKTQKKGIELSLTGQALRLPNSFRWDVLVNYSSYVQRLKEVYPEGGINSVPSNYFVSGSSDARYVNIGDRVDAIYGTQLVRTPDGQLINDAGGRPIINQTRQFLGYANPKFVWGINNRFAYKDFTFSFQFDGRVGGVIGDYIKQKSYQGGRNIETVEGAIGAARLNDVQGIKSYVGSGLALGSVAIKYDVNGNVTNYNELVPSLGVNTTPTFVQDYIARQYGATESFLINRSYAKLREVIIGYNLPQSLLSRFRVRGASVSLVGRNLLYFAERKDVDLDQYITGAISGLQTPTTRRYGINLNLTF
ncbi:TonB-linked SusC/RagA family outer membrane protein [Spirosoma oryzae]|uniref:TonB-linked SusC/RagA family outer membrane protein n=1 Tax=Spirosoma oryzae TaxID=1469603 RepID=A0A2T0T2U4_9BACT|nr:SusC/RagA family TonB-linked outer membrane protein [Spirosoma oryzae]PRY39977.1 TonB-linked SusC/RagA family outer membrane protein [Spirosoma oryzae]